MGEALWLASARRSLRTVLSAAILAFWMASPLSYWRVKVRCALRLALRAAILEARTASPPSGCWARVSRACWVARRARSAPSAPRLVLQEVLPGARSLPACRTGSLQCLARGFRGDGVCASPAYGVWRGGAPLLSSWGAQGLVGSRLACPGVPAPGSLPPPSGDPGRWYGLPRRVLAGGGQGAYGRPWWRPALVGPFCRGWSMGTFIPVGAPLRAVTGAVVGRSFFLLGVSAGADRAVAARLQSAAEGAHPSHCVVGGCRGLGCEGGPLVCVLCLLSRVSLGRPVGASRPALGGGWFMCSGHWLPSSM